MEITVIIKLPDGTTKTVELVGANINTTWNSTVPYNPSLTPDVPIVGHLSLQGIIKDSLLVGSV